MRDEATSADAHQPALHLGEEAFVVERIFADQERNEIIIGNDLESPSAAEKRVGESEAAMPGVGVEMDNEQEHLIEPTAIIARHRQDGAVQRQTKELGFCVSDTHPS